jgi:hypothetical protein
VAVAVTSVPALDATSGSPAGDSNRLIWLIKPIRPIGFWMPEEDAYIAAQQAAQRANLIVCGYGFR